MKIASLAFLFVAVALSVGGAEPDGRRTLTKTSKTAFDIPKEVAAFVDRLTTEDAEIAAQYQRLIALTQDEAGGRFKVGAFEAIEWLVPNFEVEFTDEGGTRDGEFTYLVRQQLQAGFHRGYSIPDNVVARVFVAIHEDHKPDPKGENGFVLTLAKLTLRFDGFFSVELKSK